MDRAHCKNKANSSCLLDRMNSMFPITPYKPRNQHCSTNAVAQVDFGILKQQIQKTKCNPTYFKRMKNNVWIATLVKNDAQTLVEWLVWHFLMGVEKALIYDNESTDNLHEAVKPFRDEGLVEIINLPGIGMQAEALTSALVRAKKDSVMWLAAIDVDEYIVPITSRCIPHLMQRYLNQTRVGGVRLNWQYVNSMGRLWRWENDVLDSTILDRSGFYTGRSDAHVKTIARVAKTNKFIDPHYANHTKRAYSVGVDTGRRGFYHFTFPPEINNAVLLHMHVRTLEEWIIKRQRGRGSMKTDHCPYCNASLEVLVSEWKCLNTAGYGLSQKTYGHKCKDDKGRTPQLDNAPNNWDVPNYVALSQVLRQKVAAMHAVLRMPIEYMPIDVEAEETDRSGSGDNTTSPSPPPNPVS